MVFNSVEFETEFNHSIGVYDEHKKRGHCLYVHIKEETDKTLQLNW